MSAPAGQPMERALLFDWEHRTKRKLPLLGFLAVSIGLHALGFCIFQVVYPPTLALLPPPARVSLIVPDSEEGRTLLSWIEAEDPALGSVTQPPPDSKIHALPKLRHVPSYVAAPPDIKTVPLPAPDLSIPSADPPGPVIIHHPLPPIAVIPTPTVVEFAGEMEKLEISRPAQKFELSANEPPQNARFLFAIASSGEVRYSFVQQSSGDAALDRQAIHYLALCRFPARVKSAELVWTAAEFQWGNDLAAPPSPPEPAP